LKSLPTHAACNTAAERDEAYFIVSFAGHVNTDVAREVMKDIGHQLRKGEGVRLFNDVISRFGTVTGPRGEITFSYDTGRVHAFLWKVVRGLYADELGTILPAVPPQGIQLISPLHIPEELSQIEWFRLVRNTAPLGTYGRVFDYKWLSWRAASLRGHAFAMMFWDGLLAAMLFHDPTCECGQCEDWKQGRIAGEIAAGTNRGDNGENASGSATGKAQNS
jgi:hypothetical protein